MAFKDKMEVGETVSAGVSGPTPKPVKIVCSTYSIGTKHGVVDVSLPQTLEEVFQRCFGMELHHAIEALIDGGPKAF